MDALESHEGAIIRWRINQYGYFGEDLGKIRSQRNISPEHAREILDELHKIYLAWREFGSENQDKNKERIFSQLFLEIGFTYNRVERFLSRQSHASKVSEVIATRARGVILQFAGGNCPSKIEKVK